MFRRDRAPARAADVVLKPPAPPAGGLPVALPAPSKQYADPRLLTYAGVALIALGIGLSVAGATGGDQTCATKTETTTEAGRPVKESKVVDCHDKRLHEGPVALAMAAGTFLLLPQIFNSLPGGSKFKAGAAGVEAEVGPDVAARELTEQAPQDLQEYERMRAAATPLA